MELRHYVRAKRRWLIPLILVPLLAGGATALIVHNRPAQSVAQVQVSAPAGSSNSDQGIGLYVAKLGEAFTVNSVLEDIAKKASVPVSSLNGEIAVSRIGNSDQVDVTVTTTDGDARALAIAKAAAPAGILYVATRSDNSQQAVKLAQSQLDQAQKALFAFQDQVGMLDPSAAYQQVVSAMRSGQAQLAAAQATGDVTTVAKLQAQIAAYQQQEAQLVPSVRQFNQLQGAVTAATSRVNAAQSQVLDQQTRVAAAQSGGQIVQTSVSTASRLRPIVEDAAVVAVLAFLLVLGISLLPDLFRRQRVETSREASGSHPTPSGSDAGLSATHPADSGSHPAYGSPNGNVVGSGQQSPVLAPRT